MMIDIIVIIHLIAYFVIGFIIGRGYTLDKEKKK